MKICRLYGYQLTKFLSTIKYPIFPQKMFASNDCRLATFSMSVKDESLKSIASCVNFLKASRGEISVVQISDLKMLSSVGYLEPTFCI